MNSYKKREGCHPQFATGAVSSITALLAALHPSRGLQARRVRQQPRIFSSRSDQLHSRSHRKRNRYHRRSGQAHRYRIPQDFHPSFRMVFPCFQSALWRTRHPQKIERLEQRVHSLPKFGVPPALLADLLRVQPSSPRQPFIDRRWERRIITGRR